jgi:hypothetical protein
MEDATTCPPPRAKGEGTLYEKAKEIGVKMRASLTRLSGKLEKVYDILDEYRGRTIPPAVGGHMLKWVLGAKDHVDVFISEEDLSVWTVTFCAPDTWPEVHVTYDEETAYALAVEYAKIHWEKRFGGSLAIPDDPVIMVESFFDAEDEPTAAYLFFMEEREIIF